MRPEFSHWLTDLLPRRADYAGARANLRADALAGLTVAVVALPLALAFGVTSGVGASAGIVTAVVAGVVAAVFGGSNFQVSGPTGAMTVVLVPIVERYGPRAVYPLAILAGIVVVAMSVARLGRAISYLPWPVVEGFTVGIATVIGLQQVPPALGVPKPAGENTAVVAFKALDIATPETGVGAITITLGVVLIMLAIMRFRPRWPAAIIAVAAATAFVTVLHIDTWLIGALPAAVPNFRNPALDLNAIKLMINSAIAVAALAAIESLLSARVADGLSDSTKSDPDRELFGQGLANIAGGLFGGMPATGAIARTSVNVRAGAKSRISAALHSAFLLAFVLLASPVISKIPLAALAGVLLVTAFRMVEPHAVVAILRSNLSDASVFILTAVCTVALDLIMAVEIGIIIAAILALRTMSLSSGATSVETPNELITDSEEARLLHRHIGIYRLDGALFFGAAQRFLDDLTEANQLKIMILRLDRVAVVDATGAHTLHEVISDLRKRKVTVLLSGLHEEHRDLMDTVGIFGLVDRETETFEHVADAVAAAERRLGL